MTAWRPEKGDRVIVLPQPGRGLSYTAEVTMVSYDGRARIKPVDVALSQPAWANSRRARWVKVSNLMPDSTK